MFYRESQKVKINGQEAIVLEDYGVGLLAIKLNENIFNCLLYAEKKGNEIKVVGEQEGRV
jgi:hypothetical protein